MSSKGFYFRVDTEIYPNKYKKTMVPSMTNYISIKPQIISMSILILSSFLTACGGALAEGDNFTEHDEIELQQAALNKIIEYVELQGIEPIAQDYFDLGVRGVTKGNLDKVNNSISKYKKKDVDTISEIQSVVDTVDTTISDTTTSDTTISDTTISDTTISDTTISDTTISDTTTSDTTTSDTTTSDTTTSDTTTSGTTTSGTSISGTTTSETTAVETTTSLGTPTLGNAKPTVNQVTISGTPKAGETLTLNYIFEDSDGDAEGNSIISWTTPTLELQRGTSNTFVIPSNLEGEFVYAWIHPVDSNDFEGGEVRSENTLQIIGATVTETETPTETPTETTTETPVQASGKVISLDSLKAFPTAVGVGAIASGGRGGEVIYVTNTNNSGPGSFRQAIIDADPNKHTTIMFAVGGKIDFGSILYIKGKKNITFAGQTANDLGGITITSTDLDDGRVYLDYSENLIFRFMSFLGTWQSLKTSSTGRHAQLWVVSSEKYIVDHLTSGWGSYVFGGAETSSGEANITFQHNLFVEGVAGHNVMGLIGISDGHIDRLASTDQGRLDIFHNKEVNADTYHNASILHSHRQLFNMGHTEKTKIITSSNYVYGWKTRLASVGGSPTLDIVNNYYEQNRASTINGNNVNRMDYDKSIDVANKPALEPKIHFSGNRMVHNNGAVHISENDDQWGLIKQHRDSSYGNKDDSVDRSRFIQSRQITRTHPVPILPIDDVKNSVLSNSGAGVRFKDDGTTYNANDIDKNYIDIAKSRTGPTTWSKNEYAPHNDKDGGIGDPGRFVFPNLPTKKRDLASYDSDRDGLPDAWEAEHGVSNPNGNKLNWNIQGYQVVNNAGYTNLEIFLAEKAGDFHMLAN